MAVGSKDLTMDQLSVMDQESLAEKLRGAKEELFNLRFQSATGQLENSSRLKAVKRDIARIYTVLRERELGIRETVGDEAESAEADSASEEKAED
ncbi:50S ribosomal protein L29 [Nesterenkonia aerolata]|uniref:Large ribosomal subunit protein uL29 n=1 Tax=Nesterenkonia aerolata TaxID=3074079 RepID=A0ABU2DTK0_9MICC|nr:50S ribosomal protein L29 [Nesterenkonia sp. LY-0111]MDR8019831.1 50S ribosomal protein L29 [Nesterenkonia sp. LY-0111]